MYISLGFPDSEFAIHKFGRHEIPEIQNEKKLTISEQDLLNYILETNSPVLFNDEEYLKLIDSKSQDEIDFFYANVHVDRKKVEQMCSNTYQQTGFLWLKERKIRITGTTAYSFFTYSNNKSPDWESKVKQCLMSNFSGNSATKFGKENEPKARICFEKKYYVEVLKLGFITNVKCPWLGFSPDGFFLLNNQYFLLEIKCPVKGRTCHGADLIAQLKYIEVKNEKLFLKKKHKFYAQIQLGLLLSNINMGLLVIYAEMNDSIVVINVEFDTNYCKQLFDCLTNIYFEKILPNLINHLE